MRLLADTFTSLRNSGQKALTLFLTAGYPKRDSARTLVPFLADAGADIIEVGMPFSDPLADGPVIQESSAVSIRNGMTLEGVLEDVEFIRRRTRIPLVLMGYVNPILCYGIQRFSHDASAAGVSGIILPEVPLEESERFSKDFEENNLDYILLVTPTTPPQRIRAVDQASTGFVYCVSMTGVTGQKSAVGENYLQSVRGQVALHPLQIGFGITTPDDANRVAAYGDGVIVGTALIRRLKDGENDAHLSAWVKQLKGALCH